MTRLSYEEYLRKYHTLTYKNVGVSMLPLLKQGRDSFTVREVKQGESCKLWDVVLYKRGTDQYVLHRIIKVYEDSYDILGDNCIGIERGIPKTDVLGVMTDFTHKGKPHFILIISRQSVKSLELMISSSITVYYAGKYLHHNGHIIRLSLNSRYRQMNGRCFNTIFLPACTEPLNAWSQTAWRSRKKQMERRICQSLVTIGTEYFREWSCMRIIRYW